MTHRVPICVLALCAFLLAAWVLAEGPIHMAPREGVLLLRNGRVLKGKITRDGQRYFVTLPIGEIHVKAEEVDYLCGSLEECYGRKQSLLIPGDVNGHLELAAWCIANGLYVGAQQELAAAAAVEPRHPKIALLARRLEAFRCGPPPPAESAKNKKPAAGLGKDELEATVKALPPGVVEKFTNAIQPLLQNRCSECHHHGPMSPLGAPASGFRLHRLPSGRLISQRFTLRNLHAVLATIDRDDPGNSPLLKEPVKPHGTANKPVFQPQDAHQYRQLVAWVYEAANAVPPQPPATPSGEQPPLLQPDPQAGDKSFKRTHQDDASPPHRPIRRLQGFGEAVAGDRENTPRLGGFVPRDPFDPETFNREHFPQGSGVRGQRARPRKTE